MTDALGNHQGRTITNLRFADDIDGLAGDEQELVNLEERLEKTNIYIIRHGDQCRKDQTDDEQHTRHQHRVEDRSIKKKFDCMRSPNQTNTYVRYI